MVCFLYHVHGVHLPWCMRTYVHHVNGAHAPEPRWISTMYMLHMHHVHTVSSGQFEVSLGSIWGQSGINLGSIWDHLRFSASANKMNAGGCQAREQTRNTHFVIHSYMGSRHSVSLLAQVRTCSETVIRSSLCNHGPNENHEGDEGHCDEGRRESHD